MRALHDPLLCFCFRFIFPRQSLLRQLGPERGFAELIRPELDAYFGRCFERLCREVLPRLYVCEGVRVPFTVGEYWDREVQIDVVGVRQDNWTDLGECKWGHSGSAVALRADLLHRATHFPNARQATLGLRFFTRQRVRVPSGASLPERWYCLSDLYELGLNPS